MQGTVVRDQIQILMLIERSKGNTHEYLSFADLFNEEEDLRFRDVSLSCTEN